MRRLLLLTSAIVLADTVFYAALTPLLPHYVVTFGLGKAGAGVLAAAYPAGAFVGAIPSGIVAARAGVKPTVLAGMTTVAATTVLFAFGTAAWELDLARFAQGLASSFSWTGALAWLVAAAPRERRGAVIGQAFAAAVGGALLGPVVGGIASVGGIRATFSVVAVLSFALAAWAAATPARRPEEPQPLAALARAARDGGVLAGAWFVMLPALLFGTLGVLAPLRLAALGWGAVAISAVWLVSAGLESANNVVLGRAADARGPLAPVRLALGGSILATLLLPVPRDAVVLAVVVVAASVAFGAFYTPGMALLTHAADRRGLDFAYASALINIAWAPGQGVGSALGGTVAQATSDTVPYLALAAICTLTLVAVWHSPSTAWTTPSAPASSDS